jgi:cell division protein FtsX
MAGPLPPWVRSLPFARRRRTAFLLLILAWTACGVALWTRLGLRDWCVARRPAVLAEAFFADAATTLQIDDVARRAQAQPWFCETRVVSADEARAEAVRDDRVRTLVEALGTNPFARSLRLTLCAPGLEGWAEAASWLRQQPGVASVRMPEATLDRVFGEEGVLGRVALAGAVVAGAFGLAVALAALALLAAGLLGELTVYEELGASVAKLWGRALWAVSLPALLTALLVDLVLEVGSVAARFSGALREGPAAHLPDFPHLAGLVLAAAALGAGLLVASLALTIRMTRRPS